MSKTIKLSVHVQNALDKFERAVASHAEGIPRHEPVDIMERRSIALEVARDNLHRLLLQQQSRLKSASKTAQRIKELDK